MIVSASCPAAFDKFLYAGLGKDANGMELTVLSVLARQDVDPWEAAAALSRLPRDKAVGTLVSMFALLPGQETVAERTALAGRLIPLLSNPTGIRGAAAASPQRWYAWARPAHANDVSLLLILTVLTILGGWWFTGMVTTAADAPVAAASAPEATAAPDTQNVPHD